MKIYIEDKTKIVLGLTPAEAQVLGEYLIAGLIKTTKFQRGVLNPVKLGDNLRLFSSWLIDGIRHD